MDNLKSKIIYKLISNKGRYISGAELAKEFNVSRNAVWKIIKDYTNQGYVIESSQRLGYKFIDESDILSKEAISAKLVTKALARRIEILKSVDSTNIYLKKSSITDNGYTVISDIQTSGQGRRGRVFYSPSGGVYISTLIAMDFEHSDLPLITICAAVAVCRAIKQVCGFDADIKWVNDIYHNNKKLGGIITLAQLSAEILRLENLILGIGVNTNLVPSDVSAIATSTLEITGKQGYRNGLIAQILNNLEELLNQLKNNQKEEIIEEYKKRLFILGKKILVIEPSGNTYNATAVDLMPSGELIVVTDNQNQIALNSSEISIKG